ncbi:TrbI/VirB10 family protein [Brevundimonas bacteroides]|uniref:TrbI/VirB10 family protein n=1 Tax=Brevundimonas bacteroides TaxID=74311 RepID=UPI0004977B23|nr:TrbI/VirB10 family protein [Brevundimonas bacteroides]
MSRAPDPSPPPPSPPGREARRTEASGPPEDRLSAGRASSAAGPGHPPKISPELALRAPRPSGVRIRPAVVLGMGGAAAALLAGAFAWAFVVAPELRAQARTRDRDPAEGATSSVRPAEAVTDGPRGYGDPRLLPVPRGLGADRTPADAEDPALPASAVRTATRGPSARIAQPDYGQGTRLAPHAVARADPAGAARASTLFFAPPTGTPARSTHPQASAASTGASIPPGRVPGPGSGALQAGDLLSAVLLTGVDTARPGPVVAVISRDVYDTVTGRRLLIPQGARLIGRQDGDSRHGERRAYLVWTRLILPDGSSVPLEEAPAVDGEGVTGLEGRVERRLGALVGGALFGGAFTALGTLARSDNSGSGGIWGDIGDAAAIQGAEAGSRLIGRELEVRPSVRLAPGTPVRVLLTRDLVLETAS